MNTFENHPGEKGDVPGWAGFAARLAYPTAGQKNTYTGWQGSRRRALPVGPQQRMLPQLVEWSPPLDPFMPNYFRVVPPGYSVEYVAATAIQALTVLFGVTTRDGFSLSRRSPQDVPGIESIDPGPDYVLSFPVFGLTGLHQVRIPRRAGGESR